MTPHDVGGLIGSALSGVLGFCLVAAVFVGVFAWPFLVISVVRNIRQIRVQLERLNDTLESRSRTGGGGMLGL